jgi:hypothetical protein
MCKKASMSLFRLLVSGGEHEGRYVGRNILGARVNPELLKTPEFPLPGTEYSLFVQRQAASHLSEWKALQVQGLLRTLGIQVVLETVPAKDPS